MTEEIKESLEIKGKTLEGGILVHGFKSNVSKPEIDSLKETIASGALVSPNLRAKTEAERIRYEIDRPDDSKKISFFVFKGDDLDTPDYKENAAFVAPVSVLGGNEVIQPEGIQRTREIAAFNEGGVKIPLEQGILFVKERIFSELISSLTQRAGEVGLSLIDYLKRYVVITSESEIQDKIKLWQIAKTRVAPAVGVNFEPKQALYGQGEIVPLADLGTSEVIPGELLSSEAVLHFKKIIEKEEEMILKVLEKLEEGTFDGRDWWEQKFAPDDILRNILNILGTLDPEGQLYKRIKEAHKKRSNIFNSYKEIILTTKPKF